MQSKPVTHHVKQRPNDEFRLGIASFYLRHDPTSLLPGYRVHSLTSKPRLVYEVQYDFTHLSGKQWGNRISDLGVLRSPGAEEKIVVREGLYPGGFPDRETSALEWVWVDVVVSILRDMRGDR